MPTYLRFVAALAVIAVVGVGAMSYIGFGPFAGGPTAAPTATSSPSGPASDAPSPSIDASTWTPYRSAAYGYDARYPLGWKVTPGTAQGSAADLAPGEATGGLVLFWDHFDPDQTTPGPRLTATSTAIPTGMTEDEWVTAYQAPQVATAGRTCIPERAAWEPITIDGIRGGIYVGCEFVEAVVFVDGRVYIFSLVNRFAPTSMETILRPMLESFLGTVTLDPGRAMEASPAPQ